MSTWEKLFIVAWETFFSWCLWPNWIQTIYTGVSSHEVSWPHSGRGESWECTQCLETNLSLTSAYEIFMLSESSLWWFCPFNSWENGRTIQVVRKPTNRHITHLPSSPQLLKTQNTASRNYSPFKAWGFDELEFCGSHSVSQKGSTLTPQRGWGVDGNYTWINLLPLLSARCVRPRHNGLLNILSQQGNGGETETRPYEKPFSMA